MSLTFAPYYNYSSDKRDLSKYDKIEFFNLKDYIILKDDFDKQYYKSDEFKNLIIQQKKQNPKYKLKNKIKMEQLKRKSKK